jgi:hypothetical protein
MSVATPKFGMGASVMRSSAAGESFAIGSLGEGRAAPGVRLARVGADIRHIDMPATPARLWKAASSAMQ